MKAVNQSDIYSICERVLQERRKYSNCYITLSEIKYRSEKDVLHAFSASETLLLVDRRETGNYLYYLCDSWEWLDELMLLKKKYGQIIISIVQNHELLETDILLNKGLVIYKTYQRLRIKQIEKQKIEANGFIDYCRKSEMKKIRQMMESTFDRVSDCIPTDAELEQLLENNNIIGMQVRNDLVGFVIFEDKRKTSYIRMVCVSESYRGKGVANSLLSMYFNIHPDFKSYTLWYDIHNEIAYRLYNKWGYQKENMFNYIFVV